ncbi:MAG: tRNA (guanosine(46)-N7)-methyltransferase TrmB [Gammaproteobacteria bacterium]|nr:MAG: tRNA (guanosine(46)-N7)-methyltransferase TrmB [Gammaproteobacteria bacterium]
MKTAAILTDTLPEHFRRVRSFVRRDSRRTPAQERAYTALWPRFGLSLKQGQVDYSQVFGREAPRLLEIGFGSGQSLLAIAKRQPEKDFIGIETHKPGMGALLLGIQQQAVENIRLYDVDAVEVLAQCIPEASLDGVQIFFPDPWQKRRHHARRLIQPAFVSQVIATLKPGGTLHLATDWQDYAIHIMRVLSQEARLVNVAGVGQFAARSPYRPVVTKFEQRAEREGRAVWELQFALDKTNPLP